MAQGIEQTLDNIRKELEMYADFVSNQLQVEVGVLLKLTQEGNTRQQILKEMATMCDESKPMCWVYLQSVVIKQLMTPELVLNFLRKVRNLPGLTVYNKYFLYGQISNLIFKHPHLDTMDTAVAKEELLEQICGEMEQKVALDLLPIPEAGRNQKLVVVIISQFVAYEHGPTKTALDRCATLIQKMDKTVLLINTGEQLSQVGMVPFFEVQHPAYMREYLECDKQVWKGVEIPFYQSEPVMPDVLEYRAILQQIRKLRPGWVISIGGSSLLANMCRHLVPTLAVGCLPSTLETSLMRYQTLGRMVNDYDRTYMKRRNKPESYAVECVFTSGLKEQQEKLSRSKLGIPEDAFVLEIIGCRLEEEMKDEFLDMLEDIAGENICIAFVGIWQSYEDKMRERPKLKSVSVFLGYQADALAVAELCDLYVNPHRRGGGTSCVEAMSKGVPVVTTSFGDVSVNAGESFWVSDYGEMKKQILRYYHDREFYQQMSQTARRRTEILLDSDHEFVRIMNEVERREHENACRVEIPLNVERKPYFSILMCTFNDASLLREAIRSVQQQDRSDWELIVLDNSDRSEECWEILSEEAEKDFRIRIFRSKGNVGWAKGASLCLAYARGKYMTFLAADDVLTEGALQHVYEVSWERLPDVVWIGMEAVALQPDGTCQKYIMAGGRKHFGSEHRAETVRWLMEHVYYNSFCHFERIEFLRKENIDFFEPYFMDCGGMTRAMTRAESMEVIPDVGYRLSLHTSQTANHYIMGSYRTIFADQWKSVTEILRAENCEDPGIWQYVACRIGKNFLGNLDILSRGGGCRNRYMNPVEVTWEDRLGELKEMLADEVLMDMCCYLGGKFLLAAKEAADRIISHLEGERAALALEEMTAVLEDLGEVFTMPPKSENA